MKNNLTFVAFATLFILITLNGSSKLFAQGNTYSDKKESGSIHPLTGTYSTSNAYIWGTVDGSTGLVTVLLPPGRPVYDPQLSFQNKSYFTCSFGGNYYTNNEVIPSPPSNSHRLDNGTVVKIADTVRTTWADEDGVDIIQDIYPVAFTKSGQIVYKWKFFNHNQTTVNISCQYLLDLQLTDPHAAAPNSNDGPTVLTKWGYKRIWQQFPNSSLGQTMPWFFAAFLYDLPHDPSLDPGLSSMGYLDYGAPLFLTKPSRVTIGNWYTMASTIFGASASWPIGVTYGAPPQVDNAVLTEFPSVSIPAGKMVEAGRTSYGTGEYEKCVGSLLSLVFYPEHVVWTKSNTPPPGFYTPNPIHIEKFVLNPDKVNSSANTKITLMVGDDMTISDSLCKANFGRSKTKPDSGAGVFLGPGDVAYFDWWACVSPAQFCTGPDIDSLKFTATCGICPPGFLNQNGDMQCDMTITIDCAEADIDAPEFSDTLVVHDSAGLNVHDWRTTDRGLASITWAASPGTDTSEIKVIPPSPAIGPCFTDKVNHIVKVVQLDSTVGGCYDFTFTDCLGHQSYHTVCMTAEIRRYPDSLPPLFTLLTHAGRPDTVWCTSIIDSFEVSDARVHDSGMCTLEVMPGSAQNMILVTAPIVAGDPVVRFSVHVLDSTQPGSICIRATDCSKEAHFADTCIQYCPLVLTGVAVAGSKALSLEANPNPFTHGTTFRYSVGRNGIVRLILYDELGREVARIADGMRAQGAYSIEFDGSNLPAGSYIVRLENGGNILSRKVVIER